MNTSATLNGRALAQTGAVTLDTNTITSSCLGTSSYSAASSGVASTNTTSAPNAPCIASKITTVPVILQTRRTSPTSVFLSWGPSAGIDTFNVQYGLTNGVWSYNTNVTGFSTTLNSLPANQPIWVRVAARNNCAIGTYGTPVLIGGTGSPGFPNTGSPGLPNTGFGSGENNNPGNLAISTGLVFFLLTSLVLILRKRIFLHKVI